MDYLETLRNDAKLAEEFDMLFDFRLLDGLEERDTAEGRCTNKQLDIISYSPMELWEPIVKALHMPIDMKLSPVLQKFYDAAHREPVYACYFHEDDGTVTESQMLFF